MVTFLSPHIGLTERGLKRNLCTLCFSTFDILVQPFWLTVNEELLEMFKLLSLSCETPLGSVDETAVDCWRV